MVAAQIISIFAFLLSWIWYAPNLLALPVMICIQCLWCCKIRKCGVIIITTLSAITAGLNVLAGAYILVTWEDNTWCFIWILHDLEDDDYIYSSSGSSYTYGYYGTTTSDYCDEGIWAALAFIDAALFAIVTAFLIIFLCRMDRLAAAKQPQPPQPHHQNQTELVMATTTTFAPSHHPQELPHPNQTGELVMASATTFDSSNPPQGYTPQDVVTVTATAVKETTAPGATYQDFAV